VSSRFALFLGWGLAILLGLGLAVSLWIIQGRLASEESLRLDPVGMAAHRGRQIEGPAPTLLLLGDSRAAGLRTPKLAGWTIDNRGIGGQTFSQILARGARDLVLSAPDALVIIGGINDLKAGTSQASVQRAATAALELLAIAASLEIPTLVVEVWPQASPMSLRGALLPGDLPARVEQLNVLLQEAAAAHAFDFLETDFLLDEEGLVAEAYAADALHLGAEGNAALSERMDRALRSLRAEIH